MHADDQVTDTSSTRGSAFVLGLLCGAAAGVAAGLLLAPKSGADLRGRIADSAEKLRRRAEGTYNDAADAVTGVIDRGEDAVRRGRAKIDAAGDAVQEALRQGRAAVQRGREKYDETRAEFAES